MSGEEEPKISLKDISLRELKAENTLISVKIAVNNPLFVDATIKKVHFFIYKVTDGADEEFVGEGEKEGIKILKSSENIIEIPVSVRNLSIINAAADFLTGDLTMLVRGSVFFDLKLFAPEIRFEEKKVLKGLPKRLFED